MPEFRVTLKIEGTTIITVEADSAQEALDFANREGTNSDGSEGDTSWEFGDVEEFLDEDGEVIELDADGNVVIEDEDD